MSGTLFVILSCQTTQIKILETIGSNSLFIMILHLRIFTSFKIYEKYILEQVHIESLKNSIIYTIFAVAIATCISILIKKYLPVLTKRTI